MPTLLESLGAPPQSVVPTSVMEPTKPLPAPAPAIDEFAAFEDAAPADEFAAFEDAPPDEFSAFSDADDLDVRSVEELAADRDKFNPKEYYASHPELFSDPKKAAKFLDVYRIRDEEGLDAGQVAKAAVKEALPTVGKVAGGVRDVVEGAITVGLQPVANVFGGLITGDIFNKQRREELFAETRRDQKRGVAQFGAGSEASATGIADLGRQAVRKLPKPTGDMQDATFEESMSGKPRVKKTDQELLQQISADVEFGKQLGEIVQGRGEAAKAVGLDADTLAKEGITLDPEVIERLSLVDPLTIIAGAGIFKGVTAAGKTAFTAATREAAEAAIQRIAQVATRAATSPIRAVGKGIELTGTLSKKVAPLAPTVGAVGGGVTGGLSGAGAGYLAGVGARKGLRIGGALLESGGRGVAAAGEALGNSRILQQTLRGAAEGGIATAPLVAATDDDLAAGTLLGAGIGLGGGIRGGIAAAEAPALAIARSRLAPKNIVYTETKSPGYRRDKILDAAHEEAIQSVPETEKNEINAFRETARKLDSELYFLDDANFAVATQDNAARVLGRELTGQEKVDLGRTAEAEGFFDFTVPGQDGKPRRVIFLRQSADATTHEVGHLFFKTLAPERQAELVQSVRDSYTPEQIEQVRIDQSQRLGEDKSTDYAINEIAADSFSQVFRNTPVSELTAPPGLLQEIRRNVTDFAENLGLDLTAGERTDSVGISSSLRFNDVVRDAARELLSPKPRQPVVTPKAAPITLEQAARDLGPLVEPRVARQTPARPTPEVGATPDAGAAPEAVVDEARKIADEAPDTTLPGAAMSQKEILGTVAEIIAGKEGARYNYRNAPDVPGAAEEASRAPRRAEIEQARNLPEDLRRMTETTGIPYRIVKSSGGVVQVLDWAPDMLASNALRVAKALSDLAVKDPNNPVLQKIQYGLDVQKGEWTEQGWRDIFADAEIFSANQGKGFTGSGLSLEFPPEVVAAGRTAPAVTGTPVPLEQGIADFQNMLYNLRVPKTPRQGAKLPGNLVSQKISEATLPGRLRQPALVEPRKAGETGVRKPFKSGEEILDPNPLRAEFETALQGASIPLPDGIEVVRRLNLEHIADVVAEPNLPKTVGGVTPVLEAGFAAPEREWRISGQRRGAKAQVTVKAPDIASARKVAEAQGLRVATVEAADKMTNAMFSAPRNRLQKAIEEAKNIVSDLTTGGDDSALLRSLDRSNRSLSDAELPVPKGVDRASERLTELLDDATRAASDLFEGGQFQAATAKGRATEERGFEIRHSGGPANPSVTLFKDGLPVGDISAIRKSPTEADIALIDIDKDFRGQGLSEILYREIGNRLQAEGVENVTGMVVNQRALASRSKVFPDTAIDEIEVRGRTSFMVQSPITPRSQFQAPKALAERVEKFAPDEFRAWARDEANNNVTGAANEVGRNAPDQDFVDSLKQRYDASVRKSTELLDAIRKDPAAMMDRMNDLSAILLQGQFFREAWETARGTDSAGNRLRDTDPDYVPPFPPTEAKAQFAAPEKKFKAREFPGILKKISEGTQDGETFNHDGTAFRPAEGELLDVVTLASENMPAADLTPAKVAAAFPELSFLLAEPNVKLGLFRLAAPDAEGRPQVSVDLNTVVDQAHRENTTAFARENNQESFFDLDKFETIATGGDGNTVLKDPTKIAAAVKSLVAGEPVQFAAKKKVEDKYALKPPAAGFSKAWILPTGEPVQLGGKWHHQWLAENPEVAKKYNLDVPEFTGNDTEMVREGALKAGFARVAHTQRSGSLTVEARAKDWRKVKGAVERMVESNLDSIDNMHVSLLDESATKVVDSMSAKLFEFDDAEKLQHIPFITEGEIRGQYAAPKRDGREESFFKTDGLVRPSKENLPTFDSFKEGEIALAPAWVLRDGKRAFGDSGRYHSDAVAGYDALNIVGQLAEQFQNDTGAMRVAMFDSTRQLSDYGGDLGVSISKEPSGAQVSYLRKLLKEKTFLDDSPVFRSVAIDVLNPDGSVLAGRIFAMPREEGAAMRFFRNPIEKAKGGKEITPVVFEPELEAALVPHERAYYEKVMRRDPWKDWEQRNLANQIKDMTPAERKDFSDRLKTTPSGQFAAPKSEGELGIVLPKDEARLNRKFNAQIAATKEKFPEAIPLELKKDENGNYQLDKDGKPKPVEMDYALFETPLAKAAAKGKRGDEARETAISDAYAEKIKATHAEAMKNPEIAAGADWYSLARTKLRALFGDDTKFFTELLAATSPQTDVPTNYKYSIDAYNRFKLGEYDVQLAKYKEGKIAWENRNDGLLQGMNLPVDVTRAKFMETWIDKHVLKPTQSNGKLFGANSDAVLKVLDGSWREELGGLKTGQFNDNLTGASFGATIDVWAARALHRMGNEGNPKRWRILAKNERAVQDADFHLAQRAFKKAADELGLSPDSLQAILWFAEKDYYGKKGWTKKIGAVKTDFNVLMDVTARGKSGSGRLVINKAELAKKTAPKEKYQLDFDLGID